MSANKAATAANVLDATNARLADLADEVKRRWRKLGDSGEARLDERIFLGQVLQEAWTLLGRSKTKYGCWVSEQGWTKKETRTLHWHRSLAVHEAGVRRLFGTQSPNEVVNYKDYIRLLLHAPEYLDSVCSGALTLKQALREAAFRKQAVARHPVPLVGHHHEHGDGWSMYSGDCRKVLPRLSQPAANLITWDPSYAKDDLALIEDCIKPLHAALKDQGFLAIVLGQMYMDDVVAMTMPHFGGHHKYAVVYEGNQLSDIRNKSIEQHWKPVLVFSKGPWPTSMLEPHSDVIYVPNPEKKLFVWQQSLDIFRHLITNLCPKEGTVLDPMAGVATAGVAALELGRGFIGIELDGDRYHQCVERLEGLAESRAS